MKITCEKCGEVLEIPTGHPPKLNISVTTLCDALTTSKTVLSAAKKAGCSRTYIYRELKAVGKKPKDLLR